MQKFMCEDCGTLFDEWELVRVPEECHMDGYVLGCPNCKSDAYRKVYTCKRCVEYYFNEDLTQGYCKNCGDVIAMKLRIFLNTEFDSSEMEYIDSILDGVYLSDFRELVNNMKTA